MITLEHYLVERGIVSAEDLDKAQSLKLLEVKGEGPARQVMFKPVSLGRTVACVEAVRKLRAADEARGGSEYDRPHDQSERTQQEARNRAAPRRDLSPGGPAPRRRRPQRGGVGNIF